MGQSTRRGKSSRAGIRAQSVAVIVTLRCMARMGVIVRSMFAGVIVIMDRRIAMLMPMFVLVPMLVAVGVHVFVRVSCVAVRVLVRMAVSVLVRMQMFVFVVALHCRLLSSGSR